MSMKMFFLSTFGLLKSATKIEDEFKRLTDAYNEFKTVEKSDDLKRLLELENFVQSETFKRTKEETERLHFKGSKEEASLKEFNRLSRNKNILLFYKTEKSNELLRFERLEASDNIKQFLLLKKYMHDGSYTKEKKTPEGKAKAASYHQLKNSDDIRFWQGFAKSKALKVYQLMKDSAERKRFEELQKLTNSDEFRTRKAYLEDSKKWEKTEEFEKYQQYLSLKKQAPIIRYFENKTNRRLDFFEQWQLVFSDDFSSSKLNTEKWQTIAPHAQQSLGRNYSQPGDLQAYTQGENIKLSGKTLCIETRKEKTMGLQWQLPFGFVEKEFEYSSASINTSESFRGGSGIWEAKIKFNPNKSLANLFFLANEENHQIVKIFESGKHNRLGFARNTNGELQEQTVSFSGLKAGEFYIFRIEWEKDQLIWKINNREMLRLNIAGLPNNMYINASSLVIDPMNQASHSFEFDWIRVYQKK